MKEAKEELHKLMKEPLLEKVPMVIFGNKRDKEGAMREEELIEGLNLNDCQGDWSIICGCATNGMFHYYFLLLFVLLMINYYYYDNRGRII